MISKNNGAELTSAAKNYVADHGYEPMQQDFIKEISAEECWDTGCKIGFYSGVD